MEFNILFLGGAKRVSIGRHFIQTAERLGHNARIFSYEIEKEVPIAEIAEVIEGLRWDDTEIFAHLARTINKHSINIVLPFVDPAIAVASRLKQLIPNIFIPVSPEELCRRMFDKIAADSLFRAAGIPLPDRRENSQLFPQIWKPRFGSASMGIIIARNPSQLPLFKTRPYIIQEYIENALEYTVDAYVSSHGLPLSVVPRRRLAVAGGEVVRSVTVRDEHLIQLSDMILMKFPFQGPVTLQFLRTPDKKRTLLMEINPRLGGGVITSIAAGSGIIEMILNEATGIQSVRNDHWSEGTLVTRYLQEVIFHNYNPLS